MYMHINSSLLWFFSKLLLLLSCLSVCVCLLHTDWCRSESESGPSGHQQGAETGARSAHSPRQRLPEARCAGGGGASDHRVQRPRGHSAGPHAALRGLPGLLHGGGGAQGGGSAHLPGVHPLARRQTLTYTDRNLLTHLHHHHHTFTLTSTHTHTFTPSHTHTYIHIHIQCIHTYTRIYTTVRYPPLCCNPSRHGILVHQIHDIVTHSPPPWWVVITHTLMQCFAGCWYNWFSKWLLLFIIIHNPQRSQALLLKMLVVL